MAKFFVTGGSGFVGGALIRALVADGDQVVALARSEEAAARVESLGATPARGDLGDEDSIRAAARGCSLAFHAAALASDWGKRETFDAINVEGTISALDGCAAAGVARFVHVGTEAALFDGEPMINVDESAPLQPSSRIPYVATKAVAEQRVLDANRRGFETVVVRPRAIWGPGDTTLMPEILEAVRKRKFAWIGDGRQLTSTTHIDNCVHGLRLGAGKGRPGRAYFVTDGEPVIFREFVTKLIEENGLEAPGRSIPVPVADAAARAGEALWTALPLPGRPPLTRLALFLMSLETTLDISRARSELGYEPVVSVEEGIATLAPRRSGPG